MNLMNVASREWDERLLQACGGPELRAKIGPEPVPSGTVLGKVSPLWVERCGFHPGE
jgi:xylulokinase